MTKQTFYLVAYSMYIMVMTFMVDDREARWVFFGSCALLGVLVLLEDIRLAIIGEK